MTGDCKTLVDFNVSGYIASSNSRQLSLGHDISIPVTDLKFSEGGFDGTCTSYYLGKGLLVYYLFRFLVLHYNFQSGVRECRIVAL